MDQKLDFSFYMLLLSNSLDISYHTSNNADINSLKISNSMLELSMQEVENNAVTLASVVSMAPNFPFA